MRLNQAFPVTVLGASVALIGTVALLAGAQDGSLINRDSPSAIESVYREIDRAIVSRDRAALEPLLARSFTFVHANGALDAGPIFLSRVAAGTAMVRQRTKDYAEFDISTTLYGDTTAVRRSRVRFRMKQQNVEIWMIQSRTFVKTDRWRMAISHGTRIYRGPIIDETTYRNIEGTYYPGSGAPLLLKWHGGGVIAVWPDTGTTTQVFPAGVDFEDGYRRLKFELGADGRPRSVAGFEDQTQIFEGVRR